MSLITETEKALSQLPNLHVDTRAHLRHRVGEILWLEDAGYSEVAEALTVIHQDHIARLLAGAR